MDNLSAWEVALRVGYGVLILAAAWVAGGWLTGAAGFALDRTRVDPLIRRLLIKAVRPVVLLLGVGATLNLLALDSVSTSLAAMLGASTLAIGLGLQKYLTDAAAGALLLTARPFNAGDSVNLGGVTGTVVEIGLFFTRVNDAEGNTKFVPNGRVTSNFIENITLRGTRRVNERFGLARDADVAKVRELALARIAADPRFLADPAPAVAVAAVRDEAVDVVVTAWTSNADWGAAGADLREGLLGDLKAAGVPAPPLVGVR